MTKTAPGSVDDELERVRAAERGGRFDAAVQACRRVLAQVPGHPEPLVLLGRIRLAQGDVAIALPLQRIALRHAPGHAGALAGNAEARRAVHSPVEARQLSVAACALEPEIAVHTRHPGSLEPFASIGRVAQLVGAALEADPSCAHAHAAAGNIAARMREPESALRE